MLQNKPERAKTIIDAILAGDAEHGRVVPGLSAQKLAREISWGANWNARIHPGSRAVFGPVYGNKFGDRYLDDDACRVLIVRVANRVMLVCNLIGDEIQIYRFIPGAWEKMFGSDAGLDHIPFGPETFPRPGSVEEEEFLKVYNPGMEPLRMPPDLGDEFRPEYFRKRRRSSGTGIKHAMWPAPRN